MKGGAGIVLYSGTGVCKRCGLPFDRADEPHKYCAQCVDARISQARAKGVRQERERIREAVEKLRYVSSSEEDIADALTAAYGYRVAINDVLRLLDASIITKSEVD